MPSIFQRANDDEAQRVFWREYNIAVSAIEFGSFNMKHVAFVVHATRATREKFNLVIGRPAGSPMVDEWNVFAGSHARG